MTADKRMTKLSKLPDPLKASRDALKYLKNEKNSVRDEWPLEREK